MTLIDGEKIITAQLYDDEHEEFTEKKMSIIEFINTYTDEGVTESDVVEQSSWVPVSDGLPDDNTKVIVTVDDPYKEKVLTTWYQDKEHGFLCGLVKAWMPKPKPYKEK